VVIQSLTQIGGQESLIGLVSHLKASKCDILIAWIFWAGYYGIKIRYTCYLNFWGARHHIISGAHAERLASFPDEYTRGRISSLGVSSACFEEIFPNL
jgi:hypothetical protein